MGELKNEIGHRYGTLVVRARVQGRWSCICDCGVVVLVEGNVLRDTKRNCGPNHKKSFYVSVEPKTFPMRKCEHGVYIPPGDLIANYCSLCHPERVGGDTPVLPRSSGDPLRVKIANRERCPDCGGPRLFSQQVCPVCGCIFEAVEERREQAVANNRTPGTCPDCGSTVHYENAKSGYWDCADCGTIYRASRKRSS
jgi:hypothetical protein